MDWTVILQPKTNFYKKKFLKKIIFLEDIQNITYANIC
jgi:hypothetical protein